MTIDELLNKYCFHDSCITNISYSLNEKKLEIKMDFCLWAQKDYNDGDLENIWIKLILFGIEEYNGFTGDIDYFSIENVEKKNGKLWIYMQDGINNEFYEMLLNPSTIELKVLGKK